MSEGTGQELDFTLPYLMSMSEWHMRKNTVENKPHYVCFKYIVRLFYAKHLYG